MTLCEKKIIIKLSINQSIKLIKKNEFVLNKNYGILKNSESIYFTICIF